MSEQIKNVFSDITKPFSSSTEIETTDSGFLNSNGFIAKIVFLIMVIIIFIVLFYFTLFLMTYFTGPSDNPYIIKGEIDGNDGQTVRQNPAMNESKLVQRSNNESAGIEFTWSVWLKLSAIDNNDKLRYPVFVKGDGTKTEGRPYKSINHGPGLYVMLNNDGKPTLEILMDTINQAASSPGAEAEASNKIYITGEGIPIQQYFHLAIRCKGVNIDTYLNGTVINRTKLGNVPKQNYYDILVGGFSGKLSNLRYFNRGLSVVEINSITRSGPNTTPVTVTTSNSISNISTIWYNSFLR